MNNVPPPPSEYYPIYNYCNVAVISYAGTGLSTAEAVGITFVLSSIVSFTAGLLVALVIAYCYIRQQKTNQYSPSEPKQPAPMYEDVSMDVRRDIELKENVAYRVVGQ